MKVKATKYQQIDLIWKKHGRIRIPTSQISAAQVLGIREMLRSFKRAGNTEMWTLLAKGDVDFMEVWNSYRNGGIDKLITVDAVLPAKAAMLKWTAQITVPTTQRSYTEAVRNLFRVAPDATVAQIPETLAERRDHYKSKGQRRTFDDCRKVASSFANHEYGPESPLYRSIRSIRPNFKATHIFKGLGREVWEVADACKRLQEPYRSQFWTMCFLGTSSKEYIHDGFEVLPDCVIIHGAKNAARVRKVPKLFSDAAYVKPTVQYISRGRFDKAIKAVHRDWQLGDARKTFIHWMEMARIPTSRAESYAGHDAQTMHGHYRRSNVDPYLKSDGTLIRNYIQANLEPPKPVEVEAIPDFVVF